MYNGNDSTFGRKDELSLYIARHWYGELSLARSYWINLVLVSAVFRVVHQVKWDVEALSAREVCDITVSIYENVLMLPREEIGPTLRYMLSAED